METNLSKPLSTPVHNPLSTPVQINQLSENNSNSSQTKSPSKLFAGSQRSNVIIDAKDVRRLFDEQKNIEMKKRILAQESPDVSVPSVVVEQELLLPSETKPKTCRSFFSSLWNSFTKWARSLLSYLFSPMNSFLEKMNKKAI